MRWEVVEVELEAFRLRCNETVPAWSMLMARAALLVVTQWGIGPVELGVWIAPLLEVRGDRPPMLGRSPVRN